MQEAAKIQKIVTNQNVLRHLLHLTDKLKKEFNENIEKYPDELVEAMQESPKTANWLKKEVVPRFYEGNEGLNDILLEIEKETDILVSATKLQLVIEMLSTMDESLDVIKNGVEDGQYSIEDGLKNFDEQVEFKVLH